MGLQQISRKQQGLSLVGLIMVLIALSLVAVLAMRVVPVVTEFFSIRNAIQKAQADGNSVQTIKQSFMSQSVAGYFKAVSADDLQITQENGRYDVSVAYQQKIGLFGPVSLLFEFETTTAKIGGNKAAASVKE